MLHSRNNRLILSCFTLATIIRSRSNQSLALGFSCLSTHRHRPTTTYLASNNIMPSSSSSSSSSFNQLERRIVNLNHAGASTSPKTVLDRVSRHLEREQIYGGYAAQKLVQEDGEMENVYDNVARLIHAEKQEIALVESATVGWTRIFYSMVQQDEKERRTRFNLDSSSSSTSSRVILVSEAEYAANIVAACQWARDHEDHWMVLAIPSEKVGHDDENENNNNSSTGTVDLEVFDRMLEGKFYYKDKVGNDTRLDPTSIAIVCITHVPTNSGIVNPVEAIGDRIETYNNQRQQQQKVNTKYPAIKYLVDACQSVGQMDVSVQKIKCDCLVATGRKYLRGPRGTGFLFVSSDNIAQDIMPSHVDHYGCPIKASMYQQGVQLQDASVIQFAPLGSAKRFEFWESNVASRLGLGEAVCVALDLGLPKISRDIQRLSVLLQNELEKEIPTIRIHHRNTTKCGIVTFYFENLESRTIVSDMWREGFELSVVPATSTPCDDTDIDLVRASVSYSNTEEEIRAFCRALGASYENYKNP